VRRVLKKDVKAKLYATSIIAVHTAY